MAAPSELVLVTGGSGFVGSHCLVAALNADSRVRTTVRSLKRSDEVRAMLRTGGVSEDRINLLQLCEADLTSDAGWNDASREGTLRVFRAAKAAGTVRRIVLTASTACITVGHPAERLIQGPFTEEDWSEVENPKSPVFAYHKSKTLAERAAWDWTAKEGNGTELATVHPCGTFGPVLSKNFGTSVPLIEGFVNETLPAIPQIGLNVVGVRDVADLHMLATVDTRAKGERFPTVADEYVDVPGTAEKLRLRLGEKAKKVPTFAPNWLVRLFGLFDAQAGMLAPELGKRKE